MNNREDILNSIINISLYDKDLEILSKELNYSMNKYSAKKNEIWHIKINNNELKKKDKYLIKYKCVNCSLISEISTTQFIRKINKCSIKCYLCRNIEINNKDLLYAEYKKPEYKKLDNVNNTKILNPIDIRNNSINLFNKFDDDFKENYFAFHLTDTDYNRISKHIISFHNYNLNKIDNYEYWSIYKVNNQMIFSSVIYDKINNTIFKAHQPIFKCETCFLEWRAKSLEKFKNNIKILCSTCSFVSKTFKLRQFYNCENKLILYQSKLELKFINWCNDNKILVKNGPCITYFYIKQRTYKIDFEINDILIEIKDNHIWHKNDIITGKWNAKELAVNNFISSSNEYNKFIMIFPHNWLNQLKNILNWQINKI